MNIRSIGLFSLGPVFVALLGFVTLPIITWLYPQDDVGRVAMLQVVCSFAVLAYSLGLDQAYVREYHESDDKSELFAITFAPGFILLLLSGGMAAYYWPAVTRLVYGIANYSIFLLSLLSVVAAYILRFLSLVARMKEQGGVYSASQVLPKVMYLLAIVFFWLVAAAPLFSDLALAHLLGLLCGCVFLILAMKGSISFKKLSMVHAVRLQGLLKYGLPLIFGGIAYWGLTTVDRIVLKTLSNYSELGLYAVAANFAAVAVIFQQVFSTVWAPTVYKWAAEKKELSKVDEVTDVVLLIVVLLFCLAGMFSWLVSFILPPEYEQVQYLVVICMALPLLYTLSETTAVGINLARKTSYHMTASLAAFITSAGLNVLLVPDFGATGAATSTAIAFFVFLVIRTESSVLLWRSFPRLKMYLLVLVCLVLSISFGFFGGVYHVFFAFLWAALAIFVLMIYKTQLCSLAGLIKRWL